MNENESTVCQRERKATKMKLRGTFMASEKNWEVIRV